MELLCFCSHPVHSHDWIVIKGTLEKSYGCRSDKKSFQVVQNLEGQNQHKDTVEGKKTFLFTAGFYVQPDAILMQNQKDCLENRTTVAQANKGISGLPALASARTCRASRGIM